MSINWSFILVLAILLVNIYIIKSEYRKKKIPNKLLLLLLWFNIWFILLSPNQIYLIPTLIKIWLLILWVIILFIFKIWNPSYLKYIFVSSIFFLWNWEIAFIWNIFFLILLYIIIYFFYYYIKILISYKKLNSYILAFKDKTKWDFQNWLVKNSENVWLKITTIIIWFFAVFILIRMIRYYIQWEISHLFFIIEIENITINTIVFIFLFLFIVTALLHNLYKKYLFSNYKYLVMIISFTTIFIIYEFIYDYKFISTYIHKILTFLLFLFLLIMIIVRMSKYLFFDNDSKIINYKELKAWNIIDKRLIWEYLIWQKSLEKDDISKFIKKIWNPINQEDCNKLKKLIKKNNDYLKEKWWNMPPNIIRIYNTFCFSPFVFWSFLLTLIAKENILIVFLLEMFKKIMSLW